MTSFPLEEMFMILDATLHCNILRIILVKNTIFHIKQLYYIDIMSYTSF